MSIPRLSRTSSLAIALAFLGSAAAAQSCPDWQLESTAITTDGDTAWAPQSFAATAGGPLVLAECGAVPGLGHVTQAASFALSYDDRGLGRDLDFRVEAQCDTLLLISDATAQWHYNDDEDGTLNPRLRLAAAGTGAYHVWLGTWGAESCEATLVVESFPPGSVEATCPDWSLGGAEITLSSGGSETRDLVAGGSIDLFRSCETVPAVGYVAPAPDFTLLYEAPNADAELVISATGECDTLLLVNDLTAEWLFNDDHDGLNPQISIPAAQTGRYDIWLGTYGSALCRANVTVASAASAPPLSK